MLKQKKNAAGYLWIFDIFIYLLRRYFYLIKFTSFKMDVRTLLDYLLKVTFSMTNIYLLIVQVPNF